MKLLLPGVMLLCQPGRGCPGTFRAPPPKHTPKVNLLTHPSGPLKTRPIWVPKKHLLRSVTEAWRGFKEDRGWLFLFVSPGLAVTGSRDERKERSYSGGCGCLAVAVSHSGQRQPTPESGGKGLGQRNLRPTLLPSDPLPVAAMAQTRPEARGQVAVDSAHGEQPPGQMAGAQRGWKLDLEKQGAGPDPRTDCECVPGLARSPALLSGAPPPRPPDPAFFSWSLPWPHSGQLLRGPFHVTEERAT